MAVTACTAQGRCAARHDLFPTFDSIESAEAYAHSKLPILSGNTLHALLRSYENTVISSLHSPN